MRIVLLHDNHLPLEDGGTATTVDLLRELLAGKGCTVTLITTHQDKDFGPLKRWQDKHGDIVSLYVEYPKEHLHRFCIHNPAISAILEQVLLELRPDIVHAHVIHGYLTYEALLFAKALTPKVFLTMHDTFSVSFGRVKGQKYEAWALGTRRHCRLHWWNHLMMAGRQYAPLRNIRIRRILSSSGAKVAAISDVQRRFLADNGVGCDTVIHNATKPHFLPPQKDVAEFRRRHTLTGPTVLFGGPISEDKGIEALLSALPLAQKHLPGIQVLIAGDEAKAVAYLQNKPLHTREAIRMTGSLGREQMAVAYAAADLVTTPSIYLDSFNIMNIEAMAMGKPIVGSAFGGIPEIVEDGKTGLIVNPHDTAALANALTKLLSDPTLLKHMGEAGKKRALHDFSPAHFLHKHLEWYES